MDRATADCPGDANAPPSAAAPARGGRGALAAVLLLGAVGVAAAAVHLLSGGGGEPATPRESGAMDVVMAEGVGPDGRPRTEIRLSRAAGGALPVLGEVPDFEFEDAAGGVLRREDLLGTVWAVDFIFTRCAGICPDMSRAMAAVQAAVRDAPDARLVSISTDPDHDSAAVLRAYGERYAARPGVWRFLRGPVKDVLSLSYDGFRIGDPENPFGHSERIVLVDRAGRIRGYYRGTDEEHVRRLLADFPALLAEPAPPMPAPDR